MTATRCIKVCSLLALLVFSLAGPACKKDAPPSEPPKGPEPTGEPVAQPQPPAAPSDVAPAATELTPAIIVDKAIEAAGGIDALRAKLAQMTVTTTGTYFGMPYTMTTSWRAPDAMQMAMPGMTMSMSASACWNKANDVVFDCMERDNASNAAMLFAAHMANLYPLKDEGVTLEAAEGADVEGRPTLAVKATTAKGPVPVTLYFDKETYGLAKVAYTGNLFGIDGAIETIVTERKAVDGVQIAAKSKLLVNGKVVIEEALTEAKLGTVDATVFDRPAQAALAQPKVRPCHEHTVAFSTYTGAYDGLGAAVGALMGWVQKNRLHVVGMPYFVFLKGPESGPDAAQYQTEVRVAVVSLDPMPAAADGFDTKKVETSDILVRVEQGPYDKVGPVYGELVTWAKENGYEIAGPGAMATFNDPGKVAADQLISEVWFPVKKTGAPEGQPTTGAEPTAAPAAGDEAKAQPAADEKPAAAPEAPKAE